MLTAVGFAVLIFEGSFRVRRRIEGERNAALDTLGKIAIDRPLVFNRFELGIFKMGEFGVLRYVNLAVSNKSGRLLKWRVKHLETRIREIDYYVEIFPDEEWRHVDPFANLKYGGDIDVPIIIQEMPITLEAQYTIEYDDVPPTARRISYKKLNVIYESFTAEGVRCFIVDDRETLENG